MSEKETDNKDKKKGFFAKIMDKIDKKMEDKAQKTSCCNPSDKKDGSSCC